MPPMIPQDLLGDEVDNTPDDAVTATIHQNLATHNLVPTEHLVDSGYTDADLLATSRTQHTIDLVGPVAADGSWQAKAAQGFDLSQFALDWEAQRVTCPQGKQSVAWRRFASSPLCRGRQSIRM